MKKNIDTIIPFVKMHGLGNDFVIIDARETINNINSTTIKRIANRKYGVGCDQLLLLKKPSTKKYNETHNNIAEKNSNPYLSFFIFNPDATIAQACGNGTRCVARYAMDNDQNLKNYKKELTLEVKEKNKKKGQTITVKRISKRMFRVNMGIPAFKPENLALAKNCNSEKIPIANGEYKNPFGVSIGNPHAVFFSKNTDQKLISDIKIWGPKFEHNNIFKERANISFARIESTQNVTIFVWERGAGNTNACGSAACATVVAGIKKGLLENKVKAKMQGGEMLIEWRENKQPIFMTGSADYSFHGKINLKQ